MLILWYTILSFLLPPAAQPMTGTILLQVDNIQTAEGQIRIGLFNQASDFPDDQKVYIGREFPVKNRGSQILKLENIPYGEYAIAAHHDQKNSGKMKRNLFGVPTEPYGFSNGAIAKWGDPEFSQAAFDLQSPQLELTIQIKPWSAH